MSLFPFISNTDDIKVDNSFPLYREIAWDFKRNTPIIQNGDFKIVEGNEAIKVWDMIWILFPLTLPHTTMRQQNSCRICRAEMSECSCSPLLL